MSIPPFSLSAQLEQLGPGLEEAVLAVLRSGQYIGGGTIAGFEQAFAALCGVPHAIGCNSGKCFRLKPDFVFLYGSQPHS